MPTPKRSQFHNRGWLQAIKGSPKRFMAGLLRLLFTGARFTRSHQAGFVLPVTVLLLLVVSLTVGALSFRSFSRVERTIALREQQIVDEIAAPAIDRARAKIEYLISSDPRIADKRPPSSQDLIEALLANAGDPANDPYTLPDETQLDITNQALVDPAVNASGLEPAWAFDYQGEKVVYSMLVNSDADTNGDGTPDITVQSDVDPTKVAYQVTRNGPISADSLGGSCPIGSLAGSGWYQVGGGSRLEKNIQVNVLTTSGNDVNRTVSAAEYQQVRVSQRGSRWGAWFRYDLEIFPGPVFRWNGAMHTEGSLLTGQSFKGYLVSAPGSCVNDPSSSEISLNEVDNDGDGTVDYRGELIGGGFTKNNFLLRFGFGEDIKFHSSQNFAGNLPNEIEITGRNDADNSVNDSVEGSSGVPADIGIDPVAIVTTDESFHLTPGNYRDPNWGTTATNIDAGGRVELDQSDATRPFLDDGYRADNRYGPKPRYDSLQALNERDGVAIPQNKSGDRITNHDRLTVDAPGNGEFGLDGYWERRALYTGLRAIVGQRLELGNAQGWTSGQDPLYPPKTVNAVGNGTATFQRPGEVLQQRSLRDNLAAVQGMVIYHYTQDGGQLPYMCVAATAHPGTETTLADSRTFGTYPSGAQEINFLTGKGTNGWEFDFQTAYGTPAAFGSAVAAGQPLGNALRNLAYATGDPQGGAPSFPAVQGTQGSADAIVHPYPHMAMWGDFAIMRRIFDEYLDAGTPTAYANLSPADQSTLHSAACTLGMLGNNLESLRAEYEAIIDAKGAQIIASTAPTTTFEAWLNAAGFLTADEKQIINLHRQAQRDRRYGFKKDNEIVAALTCDPLLEFPGTYTIGGTAIDATQQQGLAARLCFKREAATSVKYPILFYVFPEANHDHIGGAGTAFEQPTATEEYFTEDGVATPYIIAENAGLTYTAVAPSAVSLAPLAIGSFNQPVATVASDADTGVAPSFTDTTVYQTSGQNNRLYFSKNYIDVGGTFYQTTFLEKAILDGRELVSIRLMDLDIGNLTSNTVAASGIDWIPEKDGILYLFREDAVREDTIVRPKRSTAVWDDTPPIVAANNCRIFDNLLTDADCYTSYDTPTNASQVGTFDPPLNPTTGISVKAVDMTAEPMRRPHGFRIFNGADLTRSNSIEAAGMTLATDNTAYIKGDLNLHQVKGGADLLQEFTGASFLDDAEFALAANEGTARNNFYNRAAGDLDPRFADPAQDRWRPVEIFADAITIISDTFLDGTVEDAFVQAQGTAVGTPDINSSYANFHRPRNNGGDTPAERWQREDRAANSGATDPNLPIRVDRNGKVFWTGTGAGTAYNEFTGAGLNNNFYISPDYSNLVADYTEERRKNIVTADLDTNATRVNALLIAGITPTRAGQTYGGLHNFPRLLEVWQNQPLYISGGFFQLNFSTQATAPYDQDAWSPGDATDDSAVVLAYYFPPQRIWGYDVALQYVSAAPIAERFVTLGRPRNEYYRELPLNDEYITPLRCPVDGAGTYVPVDPRYATRADCLAAL